MIHVIATLELHKDTRNQLLREFALIKPLVAAEHGCIEYDAAVDVSSGLDLQPPVRPSTVVVVEKWTSLDTLRAHLASPHMADYSDRVKDYIKSLSLQVLNPVD